MELVHQRCHQHLRIGTAIIKKRDRRRHRDNMERDGHEKKSQGLARAYLLLGVASPRSSGWIIFLLLLSVFERRLFDLKVISFREKWRYVNFSMAAKNGNSCTSVFPNPCQWDPQEWNNTKKQTKNVRREAWAQKGVKRPRKKEVQIAYDYLIIIIILSCLTSLNSSKPIQKRISVNHEGLNTPITT